MQMVADRRGGRGVKNRGNLPTSWIEGPKCGLWWFPGLNTKKYISFNSNLVYILTYPIFSGILFWSLVAYELGKKTYSILIFLLSPILIAFFPVFLILVKFIALFHYGVHWKRLCNLVTLCEGQVEALLQLALQTYIIFNRSDRKPSLFQLGTIPISMAMIILGQTKAHYADKVIICLKGFMYNLVVHTLGLE